jgi:hypothetical protein
MPHLTTRASLAVLALVSGAVVAIEVLMTRLLSLSTWYGLAYVVLSLAMLGLTAGSLAADRSIRGGKPLAPWIAGRLVGMSLGLVVAAALAAFVPISFEVSSLTKVLLVTAAIAVPMVAGGSVIARLMADATVPIPLLYGVDLAAAAVGALAPLALLGPLSAPGAIVLIAGLIGFAAVPVALGRTRTAAIAAGCLGVAVTFTTEFTHSGIHVDFPKGHAAPESLIFEAWNPLSHVDVTPFASQPVLNTVWSPSPHLGNVRDVSTAWAKIDGDAGTAIYEFQSLHDLRFLHFDATTAAHLLRRDGPACVIGAGGGRDIASALYFGHDSVYAVEINSAVARALRAVSDRSPVLKDPRVTLEVNDGRAAFSRYTGHCRVLQASLVDTWAATSAGAFAHAESTLYTREAWSIFLKRAEPEGIVTFSRWYSADAPMETARLASLAMASLLDRGVANPPDNIALIASGGVATILVSPSAFSAEDRTNLSRLVQEEDYRVLIFPGREPQEPLLRAILQARTIKALGEAGGPYHLDTAPPSDDRPFFFQLIRPGAWFDSATSKWLLAAGPGIIQGNVHALVQLFVAFLSVTIIGIILLGPTLLAALRSPAPPLPGPRAAVYFAALGAGFMITEVALVQRMHLVLGHPTYALVFVLAGLLVATGAGSALSPRLIRDAPGVTTAAIAMAVVLIVLPQLVIEPLARVTQDSSLPLRAIWSGLCAASVGVGLGLFFPSGLRFVARDHGAPVALAINGATGVMGSIAAILVSMWYGISASFFLAGCAYFVAAAAGPARWKAAQPVPGHVQQKDALAA